MQLRKKIQPTLQDKLLKDWDTQYHLKEFQKALWTQGYKFIQLKVKKVDRPELIIEEE